MTRETGTIIRGLLTLGTAATGEIETDLRARDLRLELNDLHRDQSSTRTQKRHLNPKFTIDRYVTPASK